MKDRFHSRMIRILFAAYALAIAFPGPARAELADIADVPLANSPSDTVLPNLMYILDDSGSMLWDYMPDNVHTLTASIGGSTTVKNCKTASGSSASIANVQCTTQSSSLSTYGEPPYYASKFNSIYYNPDITYSAGVNYLGTSLGNQTPTAAVNDAYLDSTPKDLTTTYPEVYYCLSDLATRNITGSISGTTLTVTTATTSPITVNTALSGTSNSSLTGSITGGILNVTSAPAVGVAIGTTLTNTTSASFTASFSSFNTMTVTSVSSGPLAVGMTITGSSITNPTTITSQVSGTTGGTGTYLISRNLSLSSRSVNGSLTWTGTVTGMGTGTGGTGTYSVSVSPNQNYASQTISTSLDWTATVTALGTGTGGTGTYTISANPATANLIPSQTISSDPPSVSALLNDTTVCKRNGIDNIQAAPNNYFMYWSNNTTTGSPLGAYPVATGNSLTTYNSRQVSYTGNPFYFNITPDEYCSDATLVQCIAATAPSGIYQTPAYVRYCKTTTNAAATSPVSDTAGTTNSKCRAKFHDVDYRYPRYGRFTRVDIVPTTTQYTKSATATRTDCANATYCTYDEELQNFANWYSYYRTRLAMMKTASGRAFLTIDDRYRVGFITINPGSTVSRATKSSSTSTLKSSRYLTIDKFDATQKSAWYTMLYSKDNNGSTPLRQALSRVGRHYAGVSTSGSGNINAGMADSSGTKDDPIQYSCQQNFALLTTDGYYNDNSSDAIGVTGSSVGNQDNTPSSGPPLFVARSNGTLDGTGTQVVTSTPTTTVAQAVCYGTSTASFPGDTPSTSCGCSGGSNYARLITATTAGANTVTTLDGVQSGTGSTVGSTTYDKGTCTLANITTTTVTITEVEESVCNKNNSTNFSSSTNLSGSNISISSSKRNTNCSCGTSGTKYTKYARTLSYDRTTTVKDGVTTTTFGSLNGNPTFATVGATCQSSSPAVQSPNNPVITIPTGTPSSNGGTTLAVTQDPNPQTSISGAATDTTTVGGTSNTLADVAMYYYKTDLRQSPTWGTNIATDNVPTTEKDIQPAQHMVTFTLGLGVQGYMDYDANYESATTGDFANIKSGTLGACSWTTSGAQCNWPVPVAGTTSTLDDLWHAAVNGRGVFYSAGDPNSLADGISSALSALHIQTAAAAASATSSPNITQTSNFIYSSTFRTTKWDGEIVAQRIDTSTGNVQSAIEWSAQAQLDAMPHASRNIYFLDFNNTTTKLSAFTYANLPSAAEGTLTALQSYFTNKCALFSQCSLITAAQQATANDGTALVDFLRGDRTNEGTAFRARDHVMGDPVNATPAFVQAPQQAFTDSVTQLYATFKANNASRTPVLYIASNDGMLHAFNGDSAANGGGTELWSYVPRMVMPNLAKLGTEAWDVGHKFSVDGSPITGDVYDTTAEVWKTILVGGLNKGGRGFYALDVTNPSAPKALWEVCNDTTLCAITDEDMGQSYGNPIITKRAKDGKWVVIVTSGLNNVTPGNGRGYLYVLDALTGAILQKISAQDGSTTWGDTTTPSGLMKCAAFANSFSTDNTALYVYCGDLYGNVWRFDMSTTPTAYPTVQTAGVQKLAQLRDSSGKPQSITARMELGVVSGNRVVFVGTGRYLGSTDLSDPATLTPVLGWSYGQSVYAIKDKDVNYDNIRTASPGFVQQTLTDSSGNRTISTNAVNWSVKDGWYVDLNPGNTSPGERVNLDLQLQLGTLLVLTNVPNNSACTVGGDSFVYQFNYASGLAISTSPGQLVGTKTTGQIAVGFVVIRLPSGALKQIVTGATGSKTTSAVYTGGAGSAPRRSSWRELLQQ